MENYSYHKILIGYETPMFNSEDALIENLSLILETNVKKIVPTYFRGGYKEDSNLINIELKNFNNLIVYQDLLIVDDRLLSEKELLKEVSEVTEKISKEIETFLSSCDCIFKKVIIK